MPLHTRTHASAAALLLLACSRAVTMGGATPTPAARDGRGLNKSSSGADELHRTGSSGGGSIAGTAAAANDFRPPLYNITAASLYDAGRQHGVLAADRINAWFAADEVQELVRFVAAGEGREAMEHLRRDSSAAYPQYADELRGIADGAEVALQLVWTGILMIELQNLMIESRATRLAARNTTGHCSDISAVAEGGHKEGFAHGHNEDWSAVVGNLYYYVKYTPSGEGADFASCAGLAYPGALIGWAPTWNAHGVMTTVNTLVPKTIKVGGGAITTAFIQREAICGVGQGQTAQAVAEGLSHPAWSDGASINVVDTKDGAMANVETWMDQHSTSPLAVDLAGNMSHFNQYERLEGTGQRASSIASSVARQAAVDKMAAPRSRDDVAAILSQRDTLLRPITIATLLLDQSGRLEAWGGGAASSTPPIHSWNITTFFD